MKIRDLYQKLEDVNVNGVAGDVGDEDIAAGDVVVGALADRLSTAEARFVNGTGSVPTLGRFVGVMLAGPPTAGTYNQGDYATDLTGALWVCTAPGTPGLWLHPGDDPTQFSDLDPVRTAGFAGAGLDYMPVPGTTPGGVVQVQNVTSASDLTMSSTMQDIPGLSITLTTTSGLILISAVLSGFDGGAGASGLQVWVNRDGTDLAMIGFTNLDSGSNIRRAPIPCMYAESVAPGSHTYKLRAQEGANHAAKIVGSFCASWFAVMEYAA